MLSAYGTVDTANKTVTATAVASDNLSNTTSVQRGTYAQMSTMYADLQTAGESAKLDEMRTLYNLSEAGAKEALTTIAGEDSIKIVMTGQRSMIADTVVSERMDQLTYGSMKSGFADGNAAAEKAARLSSGSSSPYGGFTSTGIIGLYNAGGAQSMADAQGTGTDTGYKWIKTTGIFGRPDNDTKYWGGAASTGYDMPFGSRLRGGVFVSFGGMYYKSEYTKAQSYDTRLGLYGGNTDNASRWYAYADYGWQYTDAKRELANLGQTARGRFSSHIFEAGGEYTYDVLSLLAADSAWHVSPLAAVQTSYMIVPGYDESGAGVYSRRLETMKNFYAAGGAGLEVRRDLKSGFIAVRGEYRRAFSGTEPEADFTYEGDTAHTYTVSSKKDSSTVIGGLRGEWEFTRRWILSGSGSILKGFDEDNSYTATVAVRHLW